MPIFRRGKQESPPPAAPVAPAVPPVAAAATPQPSGDAEGQPPARIQPANGDPVLAGLLDAARERDWPAISTTLGRFTGYDLSALISMTAEKSPSMDEWLPQAVRADADDPVAMSLLGSRAVYRAWEVRTAGRASRVSQEQFKTFHEILHEAEDLLYQAADADQESVVPWYFLLMSGRGLEVGMPALQRRFEAATSRCPGHLDAHRQMLQCLCDKWFGTHEQMHAFALESMRGRYGGQLGELVPAAHLEQWLSIKDKDARRAYMTSEPVRASLAEAASRTIDRPDYTSPRSPYYAQNVFAMAFGFAGMRPQARAAFEATDGIVHGRWAYQNSDQIAAYNQSRNWSTKS